ncbi:MAG: hypothetical protein ABI720_08800 [Actinomycetes bacterium]
MSKRGMRAAVLGLAVVLALPVSGAASTAATTTTAVAGISAEDVTVRLTAIPRRVVLSPGGHVDLRYRVVVRHPESVDSIDGVDIRFEERQDSGGYHANAFTWHGDSAVRVSATKSVLTGGTRYLSQIRKWAQRWVKTSPGLYTASKVKVGVTEGGTSTVVVPEAPFGRVHLLRESRTTLQSAPNRRHGDRVLLRGKLVRFNGELVDSQMGGSWSALSSRRIQVLFLRQGATEPRVVAITTTDSDGEYAVQSRTRHSGRWWVRFPGDQRLDASRSAGYRVAAS